MAASGDASGAVTTCGLGYRSREGWGTVTGHSYLNSSVECGEGSEVAGGHEAGILLSWGQTVEESGTVPHWDFDVSVYDLGMALALVMVSVPWPGRTGVGGLEDHR